MAALYWQLWCAIGGAAHLTKYPYASETFRAHPMPPRTINPALTSPSPLPSSAALLKYDSAVVRFFSTSSP